MSFGSREVEQGYLVANKSMHQIITIGQQLTCCVGKQVSDKFNCKLMFSNAHQTQHADIITCS